MTNQELEKIYTESYRAVYWTAMSLLKNEADAEDIVQETFLTLIKSYDTIKDKSKVTSWLKKTAANTWALDTNAYIYAVGICLKT